MIDPMRKIMKLFLVLSEDSKTIEEVRPLADQLFHEECRMQVNNGELLHKSGVMADMESLVTNKVTMDLTRVEQDECGITYEYTVRKPREHLRRLRASAMVRDGKIYHVSITDDLTPAPSVDARIRRVSTPVIHTH